MIANPVLRKELLTRFRMRRPGAVTILYLVLVALVVAWAHYGVLALLLAPQINGVFGTNNAAPAIGWMIIISCQFGLVCFSAPAAAANAITQEREQQTWDMLVFTRLTPSEIGLGKFAARLIAVLAQVALFAPIATICIVLGLVRPTVSGGPLITVAGVACAYLTLTLVAVVFVGIGLLCSAKLRRTLYALMLSYTVCIGVLVLGMEMLASAIETVMQSSGGAVAGTPVPRWFDPVYMMIEAVAIGSPVQPGDPTHLAVALLVYAIVAILVLAWIHRSLRRPSAA